MRVALLGYGSFGRTLGGLMEGAGMTFRIHDPAYAESLPLPETLEGAEVLVAAVKEQDLGQALDLALPFLPEGTLVMDTCARKTAPCDLMARFLGPQRYHAGTHPRFGARSLELGLPLAVTLCPSGGRSGSLLRARTFWEALGCEVEEGSAEGNDAVLG